MNGSKYEQGEANTWPRLSFVSFSEKKLLLCRAVEGFADQLQREFHHLRRHWQSAELGQRPDRPDLEQWAAAIIFVKWYKRDTIWV